MSTHHKSYGLDTLNPDKTELIKAELDLVLRSEGFRRSERQTRFLRFVCETALSGEADHLNEYLIAHRVFERGSDYSPGEDSVVRRQAYSLRQKLQEYYKKKARTMRCGSSCQWGDMFRTFNSSIQRLHRSWMRR